MKKFSKMKIDSFYFFQIFLFTVSVVNGIEDAINFGPYELPIVKYEICKGPKKSNLTAWSSSMTLDEKGEWIFTFNMTVLAAVKLDQVKIAIFSLKDNKKDLLYAYKIKEPCKHFLFASLIHLIYDSFNCAGTKGLYGAKLNMNEILRSFLGTSFFYGDYLFKTQITSKTANLFCTETFMRFAKKGETTVISSNAA